MTQQTYSVKHAELDRSGMANEKYLRPAEAAKYVGHSQSTLAKLRMRHARKNGPPFMKRGGVVLYRRSDLDAWLDTFTVH